MVFDFYSLNFFQMQLKNMKIIIFSKTKSKIEEFSGINMCLEFNFTYAVQISLESVHS